MAKKYSLEAVFKIIDRATAPMNKIENQGSAVSRKLKSSFAKTDKELSVLGAKLKTFGKYAVGAGIGAVGVGLGVATKQFIDFDSSLHAASAAFSDMNPKAVDFADKLNVLGKAARNVAAITEFNAEQTAQGLSVLARTGLDSVNAIGLLPKIADLATAGMVGIDEAVGMATSTMNVFGKNLDQFGNKITDPELLANNMKYISDILAQTADMANHSIADVVAAASGGGSMFREVNQSIENFGALTAVLADVDIRGSEAGTMIRNIMLRLSAPAAAGEKALKKLGITTKDSRGNLLNIVDIVGQFEKSMKGLGTADRAMYFDAIFGKQNIEAAKTIMNAGSGRLAEYTENLQKSIGAAEQKAAVMRGSLKKQIDLLMSGLTELGFKFVDAFAAKGSNSIQKLTDVINGFNPEPIIRFLTITFNAVFKIVGVLWKMRTVIMALAIAWGIYKAAMIAVVIASKSFALVSGTVKTVMFFVTLATKGQAAALSLLKAESTAAKFATHAFAAAQKVAAIATRAWTAVQSVFNGVLAANPIGLVVAGIAALVAVVIVCVKHWDAITAAFARSWEWIKRNQEAALGIIGIFSGGFAGVIAVVREFWNEWDRIGQAFKDGGVLAGLNQIGATILSAVLVPLQGVFELLGKFPGIGGKFKGVAEGIDSFRNKIKGIESPVIGAGVPAHLTGGRQSLEPVSPAQQAAYYSRQDTYQHAEISVKAEPGTSARVRRAPVSPNFNLAVSGSY